MLATAIQERPFEWEEHLRRLSMAYNTSVNATTGYTPFYLMFGCQAQMPIDIMYGHHHVGQSAPHPVASVEPPAVSFPPSPRVFKQSVQDTIPHYQLLP